MLKRIKEYKVQPNDYSPKEEDLKTAIEIAKIEHCIVRINWWIKYNGDYYLDVYEDSNLEDLKNKLPKYYGM